MDTGTVVKGVLLAIGLAAMAAPALAEGPDDRFQPASRPARTHTTHASRTPKTDASPSPVTAALQWIATKASAAGTAMTSQPASTTEQRATERHGRHRVTARAEPEPRETPPRESALREATPTRSLAPPETRAVAARIVEPEPVEEPPSDTSAHHSRG